MARVLKGTHSFTCTPRIYRLTDLFAFPAEAGTHLLTREGWKAELALGGRLVTYRNKCPAPGIEPRVIADQSLHCGNMDFRPFLLLLR